MAHIALINPPSPFLLDDRVFPPLGLLQVAAVLEEAGHQVRVVDLAGSAKPWEDLLPIVQERWASVYGITATTPQFPCAVELQAKLREFAPEQRVLIGGPHATVMPESCGMFDCIVRGDGELAILEAITPEAPKILDEATVVAKGALTWHWPARHLIDMGSYQYAIRGVRGTSMMLSQGCPYNSPDEAMLVSLPSGLIRPVEIPLTAIEVCRDGHAHGLADDAGAGFASHPAPEGCVEIETRHGSRLVITPDHPIKVSDGGVLRWVNAGDLRVGAWVAMTVGENQVTTEVVLQPPDLSVHPPRKSVQLPDVLSEDLAWVVGCFLGDGSYLHGRTWGITFAVNDRSKKAVIDRLESVFQTEVFCYPASNTVKSENVGIASTAVYEFFRQSLGVHPDDKLRVPLTIRRSPRAVVRAFLDGLWAADGYWPRGRDPYLTTVSREFAEEVILLGRWAGEMLHLRRGPQTGHSRRQAWRVVWCRSECQDRRIGRLCWGARIPGVQWYRHASDGVWRRRRTVHGGISRAHLREREPESPLLDYFYDEVVAVRSVGPRRVYSISKHPTHEYTVCGVSVHNCSFCCGRLVPYYRRVRAREVDDVVREMEHLATEYGVGAVMAFDDEVNILNEPLIEFCQKIKPLGMKFRAFVKANLFTDQQAAAMAEAGFVDVCTGVESGDDRILGVINKQTTREINKRFVDLARKHGIRSKAFCSLGHPGESPESAENLKSWLLWARPDDFDVTTITVYPGTPLWAEREYVNETSEGHRVCCYTRKSLNPKENGATLFFEEIDYAKEFAFYKGRPKEYVSHVWTPDLSKGDLVRWRDAIEESVRTELAIPYPTRFSGDTLVGEQNFEHSMGAGVTPQDSRVALKAANQALRVVPPQPQEGP